MTFGRAGIAHGFRKKASRRIKVDVMQFAGEKGSDRMRKRKTHKNKRIGGNLWQFTGAHRTKHKAKTKAKRLRSTYPWKIRVIKLPKREQTKKKKYGVYAGPRRRRVSEKVRKKHKALLKKLSKKRR